MLLHFTLHHYLSNAIVKESNVNCRARAVKGPDLKLFGKPYLFEIIIIIKVI